MDDHNCQIIWETYQVGIKIVLCDSALGSSSTNVLTDLIFKTYVLVPACNLNHKWI